MVILTLAVFAFIALREIPQLKKRKNKKQILVFTALYIISFVYALLISFDAKVPSAIEEFSKFLENHGISYTIINP